jgi:hypothetical protein
VHIQDNDVRDAKNFLLAAVGAGANVGDVWLERNTVTGGRGVSVYAGVRRAVRSGIHVIDNTGAGVSHGYQHALLRFERFDGVEVRGNHQAVAKGVAPIVLLNSCHANVGGNDFPGGSGAPVATGDCTAPGLAPVTSSTTRPAGAGNRASRAADRAARRRAAIARRNAARRSRNLPPTTVAPRVIVRRAGGTNPVVVAVAFAAGALAGGGAVFLLVWSRRARSDGPPPGATDAGASPPDVPPAGGTLDSGAEAAEPRP